MDSLLQNAKNLPQVNRKRLLQQTSDFTELVGAYHSEFSETSDFITRKDESDFYDIKELRLKAKELAGERPDILSVVKGDSQLSDDEFINGDPIAVINSINPAVMNDMKEVAKDKLKTHIESARQNTQKISQQYQEGGGGFLGELGAGLLAYSGTAEGAAQLGLGFGLSGVVSSATRTGAITASRIGSRALQVGGTEAAISAALEIPLAVSEYNRDMELGLDPEYARNNFYLRLLAAPTFGFGVGGGISYLVDKVRFRGGTQAILSEAGKQQIFRGFEITQGRIGALEAINDIGGNKIKTSGKAAEWAKQIEDTGTITIIGSDLSDAQKSKINIVGDEKILVGKGIPEKTNIKDPDTSERKDVEFKNKNDKSFTRRMKDDDHLIVGQEGDRDSFILSAKEREKYNIHKDSLVLFHGSVRPWDPNDLDFYSYAGTGEGNKMDYAAGLFASPSRGAAETYTTGFRGFKKEFGRNIPPAQPRIYKIEVENPKWLDDNEILPNDLMTDIKAIQDRFDRELELSKAALDGEFNLYEALTFQKIFTNILSRYVHDGKGKNLKNMMERLSEMLEKKGYTGIKRVWTDNDVKYPVEYVLFNKKHIREITDAKRAEVIYRKPLTTEKSEDGFSVLVGKNNVFNHFELEEIKKRAVSTKQENVRGEMQTRYHFNSEDDLLGLDDVYKNKIINSAEIDEVSVITKDDLTNIKKQMKRLLENRKGLSKQNISARVNAIDNAIIKEGEGYLHLDMDKADLHWNVVLTHPEAIYGINGDALLNSLQQFQGEAWAKLDGKALTEDDLGLRFMSTDTGKAIPNVIDEIMEVNSSLYHVENGKKKHISKIYLLPEGIIQKEAIEEAAKDIQGYRDTAEINKSLGVQDAILYEGKPDGAEVFISREALAKWLGPKAGKKIEIAEAIRQDRERWGKAPRLVVAKEMVKENPISDIEKYYEAPDSGVAPAVIDISNEAYFAKRITYNSYKELVETLGDTADDERVYKQIQYYSHKIYKTDKGKNKSNKRINDEAHNFINGLIKRADGNGGKLVIDEKNVKYYRLAATQLADPTEIHNAAKNFITLTNKVESFNFNDIRGIAFASALYKGDFESFDKGVIKALSKATDDIAIMKVINNHIEKMPYDLKDSKVVVGDKLFNILKDGDNFKGLKETSALVFEGKPIDAIPILKNVVVKGKGVVELNFLYGGKTDKMVLKDYTIKKNNTGEWVLKNDDVEINRYRDKDKAVAEMLKHRYGKLKELDAPENLGSGVRQYTDIAGNVYKEIERGDTLVLADNADKIIKRYENTDDGKKELRDYLSSRYITASDLDKNKKIINDIQGCVLRFKGVA